MKIDPKMIEGWTRTAALADASEDRAAGHDGECEHGMWWRECPNQPCAEKDWQVAHSLALEALPALLAEREEMLAAIREAVELTQRPGLDTSARWALEDLAAFLPSGPRGGRLTEALAVLRVSLAGSLELSGCCPCCDVLIRAPGGDRTHRADCRLAALLGDPCQRL